MSKKLALALLASSMLPASLHADTSIISEDFDSYLNTAEMETVWRPDEGNGATPISGPIGILVPDFGGFLEVPNDNPPDLQGQGVNIKDDINEYIGPATSTLANLIPTASQSIYLAADFYDDAVGNERDSIGLRHKDVAGEGASNIIEMGFYNANDTDPIDPNIVEISTGYAYRVVLFGALGGDLVASPNWGYFPLDASLDRPDDLDEVVNPGDIGPGWHRYSATIGVDEVTFTLDLFRDGLNNATGEEGVDSTVTWAISPFESGGEIAPFNSLRFGAPSGITSAHESVIDNIVLELHDVGPGVESGDFDGDGDVDGDDFLAWQAGLGIDDGTALAGSGDANGDGNVDALDFAVWASQFGGPAVAATASVPEPTSALLAGMVGLLAVRRKRRS